MALDLTGISIDVQDFTTIAVFVIGALVTFWAIRKGIKLLDPESEYDEDGFDSDSFDEATEGLWIDEANEENAKEWY